ncbi:hypothetical protein ASG11_13930 [Sphingomonas sp. Leaf357]|uniref:hypothetical protein n=1 Tax=Sphingomonas sp. Leaf357 TaxID=1736350 RepID=UPI0006FEE9E8|nr:hypothetical protein [Sphingomonas sp. Leaf357]KQS01918.1 hypothetical protein ASG11_13930 [Sphingomonas sp. Leaf357]
MTRRDLAWRGIGVATFVTAITVGLSIRPGEEGVLGLPAFGLALFGLVLIVQGRHVPAAFRVERGRHRALVQTIRDRRRQRSG